MKKVFLTLVLGLFFIASSNAQSRKTKVVVTTNTKEVKKEKAKTQVVKQETNAKSSWKEVDCTITKSTALPVKNDTIKKEKIKKIK